MHIIKAEAAMEKGVRTSNWEAWPLSAEQIEYAAKDAALGVMAFAHRFDMGCSAHQLPAVAIEALVELEEVSSDTLAAAKAKAGEKKKRAGSISEVASTQAEPKDEEAPKGKKAKKSAGAAGEVDPTAPAEPKAKDHSHFFIAMRNSIVKAPNLGKKEHAKGAKDALKGVCIVVSGCLDSFERKDMEQYVKDHGGSVSKSVTKQVTHLVTDHGEAGPSKLSKCKELNIPVVSEDVILQMVGKTQA